MSNKRDRGFALSQGTAVSLVAIIACASATDVLAGKPAAGPRGSRGELSDRVARIVERIKLAEPELQREQPDTIKLAQWRNR
jgi:hypothetical protein